MLAAIDFLSGKKWFERNDLASELNHSFLAYCDELFTRGNHLYDNRGEEQTNYSVYDVFNRPNLRLESTLKIKKEYNSLTTFAKLLQILQRLLSQGIKLASVLIFPSNISMVLLINERGESMLIDSHEHSPNGAIVATASQNESSPLKNMVNYLNDMVLKEWKLTVSDKKPFDATIVELK